MAVIAVGQMAIRWPLTYVVDQVPFATGGVFWAGVAAIPMLLLIGLAFDGASGLWWALRLATVDRSRGDAGILRHPRLGDADAEHPATPRALQGGEHDISTDHAGSPRGRREEREPLQLLHPRV